MSKILGSWSGMRKYLEEDMLCPSLRGRVRYGCTRYVGMDSDHVFDVWVDGKQIKRFSLETVNEYFIAQGYAVKKGPMSIHDYWADFWSLMEKHPLESRAEYTDDEFCDALTVYRNQPIQDSLWSPNPIVRMFAVLDRRLGARTIEKLRPEIENQPEWLQPFFRLRMESSAPNPQKPVKNQNSSCNPYGNMV